MYYQYGSPFCQLRFSMCEPNIIFDTNTLTISTQLRENKYKTDRKTTLTNQSNESKSSKPEHCNYILEYKLNYVII